MPLCVCLLATLYSCSSKKKKKKRLGGCNWSTICHLCLFYFILFFLSEHNAIWKSMQVSVYRCRVSIILIFIGLASIGFKNSLDQQSSKDMSWFSHPLAIALFIFQCPLLCIMLFRRLIYKISIMHALTIY
jgi:xanthine/uracil permease